jgi:hypothetical protein
MTQESIFDDSIIIYTINKLQNEAKSLTHTYASRIGSIKEKSEERATLKIDVFYAAEEIKKWGIQVLYKLISFIN